MKRFAVILFSIIALCGTAQKKSRVIDSLENLISGLKDQNQLFTEKAVLLLKYYTAGDQAKAKELFDKLSDEAKRLKSDFGLGVVYNTQGVLYYYQNNFDSSLYYLQKALDIRKKINDKKGIVKGLSNIAGIYFLLNEHKKSLQVYEEGLKLETDLGFKEGEYMSLNNLGSIHSRLKVYDKALIYFRKAEKQHREKNNLDDLIYTYDGIATLYHDQQKHDSAIFYALKSLKLCEEINEQHSLSYAYMTVGITYADAKKDSIAREYYKKSLDMAIALNDKRLQLAAYGNLAALGIKNNIHLDESFKYLEKVEALQKELQLPTNLEDQPKLFAVYYYHKKDYKKAFDYLKKYTELTDSLYQKDIGMQLNEMRTKYETEKKEKENQLLQSENKAVRTTRNYLMIILAIAILGIIGAFIAYRKIKNSKEVIGAQKQLVEEKQKEILDSINYAKRIQYALLASDNLLKTHLPEHFVLFKPKAVVSGDFYWGCPVDEGFIYITADCTGHGVPGAFMSLLNISKLSQVINEKGVSKPNMVLNEVRSEIIKALNPHGGQETSKDGMDAVLCKLNIKQKKLEFSAANNSFYIVRNNAILHCKADKMPVGKGVDDSIPFSYNEISLEKGDVIYTFTDGYADQFGGMMGKKFKYKQLEELVLSIHHEPMEVQKQKLDEAFEKWKGSLEQVDDVCIVGVRIA
jgi:serine phosphatase RsbU (regulator of sigma subunit)/tetratricopeptide (TPR) repeat protein